MVNAYVQLQYPSTIQPSVYGLQHDSSIMEVLKMDHKVLSILLLVIFMRIDHSSFSHISSIISMIWRSTRLDRKSLQIHQHVVRINEYNNKNTGSLN